MIAFIGAVSFVVTGNWKPIEVMQGQGTGLVLVVLLPMVMLAPWTLPENQFSFLSYYVLRGRRLNVPDLYRTDGQFRYWNGIDPAGVIVWFAATLVVLIWFDIAFLFGFPAAFVLYYVLMRFWVISRCEQAEMESGFSDDYLITSAGLNWVCQGRRLHP